MGSLNLGAVIGKERILKATLLLALRVLNHGKRFRISILEKVLKLPVKFLFKKKKPVEEN